MFFEHGGFGTLVGSWDEYAARDFSARLFLWNGKFSLEKAHTTVLLVNFTVIKLTKLLK